MLAKWERKWHRSDSQEVGLEAAILERVRNSSLVESACADNVPGIKSGAEAMAAGNCRVGERRVGGEAAAGAAVERTRVRMPV